MNKKNLFGTICKCGKKIKIYLDSHPYGVDDSFVLDVVCPKCKKEQKISKSEIVSFYENEIRGLFDNAFGNVLEIGCGGGFITRHLLKNKNVKSITAIDVDDISFSHPKLKFIKQDLEDYKNIDLTQKYDFLVCKDIFMYLMNLEEILDKILPKCKNIILLNWYNKEHKNCKNKNATPLKVKHIIEKHFKTAKLTYPKIYKWNYLITNEIK